MPSDRGYHDLAGVIHHILTFCLQWRSSSCSHWLATLDHYHTIQSTHLGGLLRHFDNSIAPPIALLESISGMPCRDYLAIQPSSQPASQPPCLRSQLSISPTYCPYFVQYVLGDKAQLGALADLQVTGAACRGAELSQWPIQVAVASGPHIRPAEMPSSSESAAVGPQACQASDLQAW